VSTAETASLTTAAIWSGTSFGRRKTLPAMVTILTVEHASSVRRSASVSPDQLVVVADGDYVVQFGVRGGRWGGGPFLGVDAPAGDYSREVAFVYRLIDRRIAERWAVRDDLTMLRQLGALT
jgi:hypothetical protein